MSYRQKIVRDYNVIAVRTRGLARVFSFLLVFSMSLVACSAHATMELSNVILHFEPGEPNRQDVEVSNPGEEPLYVQIEPKIVLSPGSDHEDRAPIDDPRDAGLLVTPNKLIVPPGATRVVRFVKLGSSPTERVYRVSARPIANEIEATQTSLKILIGYEVLAIVYPNNPKPRLEVNRNGKLLTVRNAGNTNVLVREGYQCREPDQPHEDCIPLAGKRIYPGNTWQVELPEDLPVTLYQSVANRNTVEVYP